MLGLKLDDPRASHPCSAPLRFFNGHPAQITCSIPLSVASTSSDHGTLAGNPGDLDRCCMWITGKNSRCRSPTAKLLNMQDPNYQFETRRKEMEKKAKNEEKRRLKLADSRSGAGNNTVASVPIEPV